LCPDGAYGPELMQLHPVHTPAVGDKPTPLYLGISEDVCAKDVFSLPRLWSEKWGAQCLTASVVGGSLHIEHGGVVVVKVALAFAETALCKESEFPSYHAGLTGCSLLAVMPDVKQMSVQKQAEFHPNAPMHLSVANTIGMLHSLEEGESRRPVWILLMQADAMEMVQSMTAIGAIRTDFSDVYAMSNFVLGKGSFAQVQRVHPCSQQTVPGQGHCNQTLPNKVAKTFIPCQTSRVKNEVAALLAIGPHAHVVSFHGIFASKSETGKRWTLLLGYCAAGDLLNYLRTHGRFDSLLAKNLARSMLDALVHIHSRKYMHCDIKPDNVLIDATGCFVLADFSESVPIPVGQWSTRRGTTGYMAPEVFNGRHYNELVDLFSLGALLHLCICGHRVFPGQSSRDIEKSNGEGKIDLTLHAAKFLNAAGLEFLDRLLAREPSERPSAKDALEQPWLREGHEHQAVKAGDMSETLEDSSSDNDSCSDTCHDSVWSSRLHNSVHNSGLGRKAKSSKLSLLSSFRGLFRSPGSAGVSTKVVPSSSKDDDFRGFGSASEIPIQEAHGTHGRFATRASKVVTWIRGTPTREGFAPEKHGPHVPAPVVCNW